MQARLNCTILLLTALGASCAGTRNRAVPGGAVPMTVVGAVGLPPAGAAYAGAEECGKCHGAIYGRWSESDHARSYETISDEGEENNPACLRCHTTGYGKSPGFIDALRTPDLARVTCEACHGPSGDHAASSFPGLVPSTREDECSGCNGSRLCRECHTTRHSPGFEFSSAMSAFPCTSVAETSAGAEGAR